MDFASLLSSRINKSKQETKPDSAKQSPSSSSEPKPGDKPDSKAGVAKKYLRKADIEAAREAAYLAEQEALAAARAARAELKRKADADAAAEKAERDERRRKVVEDARRAREEEEAEREAERRRRLGLPPLPAKGSGGGGAGAGDEGALAPLDDDAVAAALTDAQVRARLAALGREEAEGENEGRAGRLARLRVAVRAERRHRAASVDRGGAIATTLPALPERELRVARALPAAGDGEGRERLARQLVWYFNLVLAEWAAALDGRDEEVKESFQGRAAARAMEQAREGLVPMVKKLEVLALGDTLLGPVVEIVADAQERKYVSANDGYLRLSIGKAAWPIGVTMVGIHERSAREKLHQSSKNQAHIMSDETTRKFLQSIKRCLTFAQTRWPPDDQMQLMG